MKQHLITFENDVPVLKRKGDLPSGKIHLEDAYLVRKKWEIMNEELIRHHPYMSKNDNKVLQEEYEYQV